MPKIVLHIGLHKTGTTAFQNACTEHRDILAEKRVYYPNDQSLTLGTSQHQGLVTSLRTSRVDQIRGYVENLVNLSAGYDILLLSSEEFSSLFGNIDYEDLSRATDLALKESFSEVRYICTIRDDQKLFRSMLREIVEAVGVPFDGTAFVREEVARLYSRSRQIMKMLGDNLTVLGYETLATNRLVHDLLLEATGIDFNIPEEIVHSTSSKDTRLLLMNSMRMLLFNALEEATPYSFEVERAYSRIFHGILISPNVEQFIEDTFQMWLDRELSAEMKRNSSSLSAIFSRSRAV